VWIVAEPNAGPARQVLAGVGENFAGTMRLGGPVAEAEYEGDPERWIGALRGRGYGAAYCPVGPDADDATVRAFVDAARDADVVIAEVGAWSNPLHPDPARRRAAIRFCQERLALAERIGARCCVNIAGSRDPERWDGPHPDNLSEATFDLLVETVREIIDAVRPARTCYALETMPWMFPDGPGSYARLIRAIDRPNGFGVHLDPVNLVSSPQRFFGNADLLRECFATLGPHILGCHAKDIALSAALTVHLDEVRPGLGGLDYQVFLRELDRLDPDTPLLLEHLPSEAEYAAAARHLRDVAAAEGIAFR
jgi:sugar phosphate isomerase/epimerase